LSEGKDEIIQKILTFLELRPVDSRDDRTRNLTQREVTIVRLVSKGLTNKQIAQELFLSTHTVTTHRKNITSKLGIKSVSGLTVYAIVNNIITIEEVVSKPSQ
jgi:DNA-binding NarL/FixJ family response regulator